MKIFLDTADIEPIKRANDTGLLDGVTTNPSKIAETGKKFTDVISFNPTNVQRNTLVEFLWRRKQYRPVWLWSVVEILKKSKKIVGHVQVKCDIVGGGSIRGAHNCRECDHKVLSAIESFSLSQDIKVFESLDCECKDKWLDQLDIEDIGFGSLIDMAR